MSALSERTNLVGIMVGTAYFMHGLDTTIITTAVPAMANSFHVDPVRLDIAVVAYAMSMAVFLPISGWLSDRFGASRTFISAVAIFTLGSLFCAVSQNIPALVLSRILQGLGSSMMIPVGRVLVLSMVPKSSYVRSLAGLGVYPSVGMMLGPPVGGFLTTFISWRWIFLINIPVGLAGIVLGLLFIKNIRRAERHALDWKGFVLTALSLSAIMYGFEGVGRGDSDMGWMIGLLAFGLIVGMLSIRHALREPFPLLDLAALRIQTLRVSVIGGSLFRIMMGGLPFLLPVMLQVVFGRTAFQSGSLTLAIAIGVLSVRFLLRRMLKAVGLRTGLSVNAILCTLGAVLCCLLNPDTPAIFSILLFGAIGVGQGFQFTALNTLSFADTPDEKMGTAASFSQIAQQFSQATGVALAATLLHIAQLIAGNASLVKFDFTFAFLVLALVNLVSLWSFLRLPPNAGSDMTGHQPKPVEAAG